MGLATDGREPSRPTSQSAYLIPVGRRTAKPLTVTCDFIFWDWKQEPDFKKIEAVANWMLEHGAMRVHFARAETETDDGCLVVSDSALSDEEATLAY